jgi:hypothetical protein
MTHDSSSPAAAVVYGRRFTLDGIDSETLRLWSEAVTRHAPDLVLLASGNDDGPRYGEGVVGVVWSRVACDTNEDGDPLASPVPSLTHEAPVDLSVLDGLDGPTWANDEERPLDGWFLLPVGWSAAVLRQGDDDLAVTSSEDTTVAVPLDPELLRKGGLTLMCESC